MGGLQAGDRSHGRPARVALLGAGGFGRNHLTRLARLSAAGRVDLVGIADPAGPNELVPPGTPVHASLDDLLAAEAPGTVDVVIVSTPIHTHVPLAATALRAGANVYLEKPPAASLAAFDELIAIQQATGLACQVGFQSLGSYALDRMAEIVAEGVIGRVERYEARGLWLRDRKYYARSAWAGRRRDGDVVIADGVTTNPLSHSIATALRLAGLDRGDSIGEITTELYRAHAIEGDDTSFVRVVATDDTPPVLAGLTLCAPEQLDALVDIVGSEGRLSFHYSTDVLEIIGNDGVSATEQLDRVDLMDNLLDHLADPAVELLSPLARTRGFTAVLQAVLDASAPTPLAEPYVSWVGEGEAAHPVLTDIGGWIEAALTEGEGYAAAGAPWAVPEAVTRHRTTG